MNTEQTLFANKTIFKTYVLFLKVNKFENI